MLHPSSHSFNMISYPLEILKQKKKKKAIIFFKNNSVSIPLTPTPHPHGNVVWSDINTKLYIYDVIWENPPHGEN